MNIAQFNQLSGKTVRIKKYLFEDGYAEEGMYADIENVKYEQSDCSKIYLNYSRFEEHNKTKELHNYWDENRVACLTAREADCYPKDHKEWYYVDVENLEDYIEIVDKNSI